jgi:hypothetical protein
MADHRPCNVAFAAGSIGLFLASIAFCASVDGENPIPRTGTADEWSTIKSQDFTIYYVKKFADDAQRAKTYLDSAIASLRKEFSDYEPDKILKKIDCFVYLYPEPNETASDGRSVCITRGIDNGRRHAELHFLTPARYSPSSTDSIGELKKEDHYFFRYIVHEYASIWLGVIARSKERGWYVNGNDAPNWFWQGYEEYLGMTLSSAHSRTVTFSKYMAVVKEDPDSVVLARGYKDKTPRILVGRDYTDGFAILAYMHHKFGTRAVQRILISEKDTFREAARDSFQTDDAALYEGFQAWVKEWKSP